MAAVVASPNTDSTNFLTKGFRYIEQHQLILCIEHKALLTLPKIKSHLEDFHALSGSGLTNPFASALQYLKSLGPIATNLPCPTTPISPIPELGKPVKGYRCSITPCNSTANPTLHWPHVSKSFEYAKKHRHMHIKGQHPRSELLKPSERLDPVWIQEVQCCKQNFESFIVVKYDPTLPIATTASFETQVALDHFDRFMKSYDDDRARDLQTVITPSLASLNSEWLIKTRMDEHLCSFNVEQLLQSLVVPTSPSPGPGPLFRICTAAYSVMKQAFVYTRVNSPESKLSEACGEILNRFQSASESTRFHPVEEERTQDKYIRWLQQFICYAYNEGYIKSGLAIGFDPSVDRIPDVHPKTPCKLTKNQILQFRAIDALVSSNSPHADLEQATLELLMAFIAHPIPGSPYASPLVSFFAVHSLRAGGGFEGPSLSTPVLSGLIKCGQLIIFTKALHIVRGRVEDIKAQIKELCSKWLVIEEDVPLAQLNRWRAIGMNIAKNTVPMPRITWSNDGGKVTYDTLTLSMENLRGGIQASITHLTDFLERVLLFNLLGPPRPDVSSLQDVLTDMEAGHSFIRDPRNVLFVYRTWLQKEIANSPYLSTQFFTNINGQVIPNRSAMMKYVKEAPRFLNEILCLIYFTSGLPPRGTELMGCRVENGHFPRTLYVFNGELCLATYYIKRRWSNGDTPVVRFLHPDVSALLIQYLTLVRPFVNVLENMLYQGEQILSNTSTTSVLEQLDREESRSGTRYSADLDENPTADEMDDFDSTLDGYIVEDDSLSTTSSLSCSVEDRTLYSSLDYAFLFRSYDQGRWNPPTLSSAIQNWFTKYAGVSGIRIREARQLAKAIDRKFNGDDGISLFSAMGHLPTTVAKDSDPIAALQAGSRAPTANVHYANDAGLGRGLTDDLIHRFRKHSRKYQTILGMNRPPEADPAVDQPIEDSNSLKRKGLGLPGPLISPSDVTSNPSKRMKQIQSFPTENPPLPPASPLSTPQRMAQAEAVLCRIYGEAAKFRDNGQYEAIEAILYGHRNIFVVLPTGAGKTVLYLVPSLLSNAAVNIVIVPLIVLRNDLEDHCREHGIGITVWTQRQPDNLPLASLVLVGVEDATSLRFLSLVNGLDNCGRLGIIYIDEIHLAYTAADYRPLFLYLREFRHTSAQIVCLSATVPPSALPEICARLDMIPRPATPALPGVRVVRRSTNRPELQYEVKKIDPTDKGSGVIIDRETMDEMRDEVIAAAEAKGPRDRILCYIQNKCWCEQFATRLESMGVLAAAYHGGMGVEERNDLVRAWKEGKFDVLVGTSCLASSLHYNAVSRIFLWNPPSRSVADLMQALGRGARGIPYAKCTIFLSGWKRYLAPAVSIRDAVVGRPVADEVQAAYDLQPLHDADAAALDDFLFTLGCRRAVLTRYLDGRSHACPDTDSTTLCDNCVSRVTAADSLLAAESTKPARTNTLWSKPCTPEPKVTFPSVFCPPPDLGAAFTSSAPLASSTTDRNSSFLLPTCDSFLMPSLPSTHKASPVAFGVLSSCPTSPKSSDSPCLAISTRLKTPFRSCRDRTPTPGVSLGRSNPIATSTSSATLVPESSCTLVPESPQPSDTSSLYYTANDSTALHFSPILPPVRHGTWSGQRDMNGVPFVPNTSSIVSSLSDLPPTDPTIHAQARHLQSAKTLDRFRLLLEKWSPRCFFCSPDLAHHIFHDPADCPRQTVQDTLVKARTNPKLKFSSGYGCFLCSDLNKYCHNFSQCRLLPKGRKCVMTRICLGRWLSDGDWRLEGHKVVTNGTLLRSEEELWDWMKKGTIWCDNKCFNCVVMAAHILFDLSE